MKYFFITGMGRSDTKWTANTIKLYSNEDDFVDHEFIGDRNFSIYSYYLEENFSDVYLAKEYEKVKRIECQRFIDVNGHLKNATPSLEKIFEQTGIFHLIRDPRDVVRSIFNRRLETGINELPKFSKKEIQRWLRSDKLVQICLNWVYTTNRLLDLEYPVLHFEKLIEDYQYFKNNLLIPLNLKKDQNIWLASRNNKINNTRSYLWRFLYSKSLVSQRFSLNKP